MTCKLGTHLNQLANARFIVLNQSGATGTNRDLGASIMPDRPVGYPKKMERHFAIKPGQPRGTANFGLTGLTGQNGPPPEVVTNISVTPNRNRPFHLTSDRNFRNFWHNGEHP